MIVFLLYMAPSAYAGLLPCAIFPPPRAAAGMRVTEVRPRSEPIGEASSEAGWHITRRPERTDIYDKRHAYAAGCFGYRRHAG